jgi:hypothetical protein
MTRSQAFEKDQPCEESRKGFMWRLTDEAIREGVKSTTRYRSKQPNKRGHRTQQPQPQRQASGAKGGQAAKRSARMKRNGQYRTNEQYISRSVPAAFDPSYHGESSMPPYPPSPYYGGDVDFGYASKHGDFGGHDLFGPARSYSGSPHGGASVASGFVGGSGSGVGSMMGGGFGGGNGIPITDTAYVLDQSPTDSLFTNSPSPSDDQPRTPVDQGWQEEVGVPCVFEDQMRYREYAG